MGNHTQANNKMYKKLEIYALAIDPIYIGTGGYNIGKVDNTIVRDPITNVPKIPGSSLAGTWRYYVVLELIKKWKQLIENLYNSSNSISGNFKNKLKELINSYDFVCDKDKNRLKENVDSINFKELDTSTPRNFIIKLIEQIGLKFKKDDSKDLKDKKYKKQEELFQKIFEVLNNTKGELDYLKFTGNRFLQITCAGQDNVPQEELENAPFATNKEGKTGHCGHCIVCKGFGFSKRDISWQGMIFFSDLNILFFPVFTYQGTKWITTASKLKEIGIEESEPSDNKIKKIKNGDEEYLNLGWLYLEVEDLHSIDKNKLKFLDFKNFNLKPEDIIIVPESLFSHIVNSNLEVRTSVSIDPITGAAKEGALFTSEAIPRGTIFYGEIRIFDKKGFEDLEPKLKPLPEVNQLEKALEDSKHFFETLGIGGMTTRGFGRLKIKIFSNDKTDDAISNTSENEKAAQEGGGNNE